MKKLAENSGVRTPLPHPPHVAHRRMPCGFRPTSPLSPSVAEAARPCCAVHDQPESQGRQAQAERPLRVWVREETEEVLWYW